MRTNSANDEAGGIHINIHSDDTTHMTPPTPPPGARIAADEIVAVVRAEFDRWVDENPELSDPIAQAAVFAIVVQKLVAAGFPLTGMMHTVMRAHGLRVESIAIDDPVTGKRMIEVDYPGPEAQ